MKRFSEFEEFDKSFWANIKLVSERIGYSERNTKKLKRYSIDDIKKTYELYNLDMNNINDISELILGYLNKRNILIEEVIYPLLMDRDEAMQEFHKLYNSLNPKCNLPMNKQKGEKKHYAYLTCIVNMLTEKTLDGVKFDDNPRGLTVISKNEVLLRTFSRWMDGAYPSINNPIAVWEIKEYYGTTTFGSRVADGVYETILDGTEFIELYRSEGVVINNYLIVDDRFTWWGKGKSYLCRLIDILNMGIVKEIIFGREVLSRWPEIVKSWNKIEK